MERRDVTAHPRPVFIVTDEGHLLAVRYDQTFQKTARSSRTAVFSASQSVSNYLAALGPHSEAAVDSLLGNYQAHLFGQQSCVRTNTWAAELCGKRRKFHVNAGTGRREEHAYRPFSCPFPNERQLSAGVTETIDYGVPPSAFSGLRKPSPSYPAAEAIVYQGGRRFPDTGRCWRLVTFPRQG
jgi:hypothetical protein